MGSDEFEFFLDFWGKFKEYHAAVEESEDQEKWRKLEDMDTRRTKRRQGIL